MFMVLFWTIVIPAVVILAVLWAFLPKRSFAAVVGGVGVLSSWAIRIAIIGLVLIIALHYLGMIPPVHSQEVIISPPAPDGTSTLVLPYGDGVILVPSDPNKPTTTIMPVDPGPPPDDGAMPPWPNQ